MPAKSVLILSNDRFLPTSKTSEMLAAACRRLGIPVLVRDGADARYLGALLEQVDNTAYTEEAAAIIKTKFQGLILAFEVDTVLSLDVQWLFVPGLFTENPEIQHIHSLWFDDMRSWARANYMFAGCREQFQDHVRHPKVSHYFYGRGLAEEGKLLGMESSHLSYLAAPHDYLQLNHPCEIRDRVAFIGNPGFREPPPSMLLNAMRDGAEIDELRKLSGDILIHSQFTKKDDWLREEPSVQEFLQVAIQARVQFPYRAALEILQLAAAHYPKAFDYLNRRGEILDATMLVKLVNRCDRPAVILRLYRQGLVDVYSNEQEWVPYDVKALPSVLIPQLPRYYQKYAVHLNAANALRDATANEKLFEIAACGRVSLNLHSPDVAACYGPQEVGLANSLAELEAQARELLSHPEQAMAMGKRARVRTSREHLWEHRLKVILGA
ncbi:MAG: hypothetical protein B9S32_17525 [Verrucomicrobia bacterium Tous-C9LFEB]|nr:MAG: hypothetical protein B9S32_17525 [Verrucomicrobia bacterium Tous-C9LFEB]